MASSTSPSSRKRRTRKQRTLEALLAPLSAGPDLRVRPVAADRTDPAAGSGEWGVGKEGPEAGSDPKGRSPSGTPSRRPESSAPPPKPEIARGTSDASPDSPIQNPKSKIPNSVGMPSLGPALSLLPYQRRWLEDSSPLKLVVKARQIGYSFAATLRAVLECLKGKTTWIFLSKGERQSRLLMEKVQEHIQSCGLVARTCESTFFEGTMIRQLEVRFPNGSVIYGLPTNPDTARGYSGHVTLDEFAFHADADKIYAALFPTITRGFSLEVISTPNGTQGKFFELAKAAGLEERKSEVGNRKSGDPHFLLPTSYSRPSFAWSAHLCDIYGAVEQGLKADLVLLHSGCEDESTWLQEYCCQFVSTAENFIPPELLAACLSAEATADVPIATLPAPGAKSRQSAEGSPQQEDGESARQRGSHQAPGNSEFTIQNSEFFLGIDIGRHHDRTVFWLDEVLPAASRGRRPEPLTCHPERSEGSRHSMAEGYLGENAANAEMLRYAQHDNVAVTRLVRTFADTPFDDQLAFARELLSLDGAGGRPLVRRACIDATGIGAPLAESLAREFAPRVEPIVFTAAVKEDLAYRTRRRMEARLTRLPDTREIRRAFSAIKRLVTPSGNFRFDAARSDAGHADEFWAKALADLAADSQPAARAADAFLADGAPIFNPGAFVETRAGFSIWEF